MSEFKFSCPNCQQNIQATSEYSGHQINCPSCQTLLVVPAAPDAPAPAAATAPHGPRLSKAATSAPVQPSESAVAAASFYSVKPMRKKKSKVGLIVGLSLGAVALAAAIYFWPELMKKVSHGNQTIAAADLAPTNVPPPPPPELTTEEILQKVADTYKGLNDYGAKAKTVGDLDMSAIVPGQKNVHLASTSSLQLGRTNFYRLEWEQNLTGTPVKGAAWNSGRGNFVGYGPYKPSKVKTRQEALMPAATTAFVLSSAIVEIFFSGTNSVADDAKDFTKTNSPELNLQNSYLLTGEANHQSILLWVNKDSFLVSQIEIILGGKIDEAELKKLPAAQRSAMTMLSKLKGTITETYDNIQTNHNLLASAFESAYQPTVDPAASMRSKRPSSMAGQLADPRSRRTQQPQ
jgi:hypothetical protein